MASRHQGLGRGFGEFFQRTDVDDVDAASTTEEPQLADGSKLLMVNVDDISPNPRQPRSVFDEEALEELAGSIAEVGLLQPVVVTATEDGYELVMGERRWRASQRAGLSEIPAIVRATEAEDLLRDALLENLHRVELNPIEEAAAYQQLLDDFGCTQEELSGRIKRSRSQIANTIRLLRLPGSVQKHLLSGDLTAGHARALLGLDEPQDQERLAERIVAEGLTVRATEAAVRALTEGETQVRPHARRKPGHDAEATELGAVLTDRFDTDVTVRRRNGKGTITLAFDDTDELERLVSLLQRV